MADPTLRPMEPGDRHEIAELIAVSLNHWYQTHAMPPIFPDGPQDADVFCAVYGRMEGSDGVVAVDGWSGRLAGVCFHHARETHMSLGIMSVHPNHFGRGVGRGLLRAITDLADERGQSLRLVSSALNLDSFSLYTRAGFVPIRTFQDLLIEVPDDGLQIDGPSDTTVREATPDDVGAMGDLEQRLSGIRRDADYRYFIDNPDGFWHASVARDRDGALAGWIASSRSLLGPGVAVDEETAEALLVAELDRRRGRSMVFLLPVDCGGLVQRAYGWGARNCEIHLAQVRGDAQPLEGVTIPTFMPETG